MQGVVEEKMQRIAEVLLGSVPPFELMLGKLLGMVGVSLTIGGGLPGRRRTGRRTTTASPSTCPPALLAWFLVFLALAVLMYGSLFIAVGAACTRHEGDAEPALPVMLLACCRCSCWATCCSEPNGTVATALSFFPFATPMLMMARQAVPPGVPWWQPVARRGAGAGDDAGCASRRPAGSSASAS